MRNNTKPTERKGKKFNRAVEFTPAMVSEANAHVQRLAGDLKTITAAMEHEGFEGTLRVDGGDAIYDGIKALTIAIGKLAVALSVYQLPVPPIASDAPNAVVRRKPRGQ